MTNIQSLIQIYNTCFYLCLALGILALASAVFIFFKFDVRTNFAIRTGRAEKITVKRVKGKNSKTDTLQQMGAEDTTGELPESTEKTEQRQAAQDPNLETETELLTVNLPTAPDSAPTGPASSTTAAAFGFLVTEDTIITHTDEKI